MGMKKCKTENKVSTATKKLAELADAEEQLKEAFRDWRCSTLRFAQALVRHEKAYRGVHRRQPSNNDLKDLLGIELTEQRLGQLRNTAEYFPDLDPADAPEFRWLQTARQENLKLLTPFPLPKLLELARNAKSEAELKQSIGVKEPAEPKDKTFTIAAKRTRFYNPVKASYNPPINCMRAKDDRSEYANLCVDVIAKGIDELADILYQYPAPESEAAKDEEEHRVLHRTYLVKMFQSVRRDIRERAALHLRIKGYPAELVEAFFGIDAPSYPISVQGGVVTDIPVVQSLISG